jgi:hypothetical protein
MQEKADFLNATNAILIGALMAFFMEIAEYLVVNYTSSLTLSVAGIFKVSRAAAKNATLILPCLSILYQHLIPPFFLAGNGRKKILFKLVFLFLFYDISYSISPQELVTLCLAVIFNGDQLTFINFIGLVMCFTGIICHVGFKFARSTTEINSSSGAGGGCASIVTPVNSSGSNGGSSIITSGTGGVKALQDEESVTPLLADQDSTATKNIPSTRRKNLDESQSGDSDEENNLWNR